MSEEQATLLEFPCEFPVKVFGLNQPGLTASVLEIARRHAPEIAENALSSKLSGGGKYMAVTVTIQAQSKAQLEAIYRDLTSCPDITMAL